MISLKKLKELSNKSRQTHIINLGKIDANLEGINLPIKVKTYEETIKLKDTVKLDREKLTIKTYPFTRLPKSIKETILKDDSFKHNMSDTTWVQVVKLDEDVAKLKRAEFRERLFSILIHIDMDYVLEDGITMWEDAGLKKGDYIGLVNLFSGIIKYEEHIDLLEVVINTLRNGQYSDEQIDLALKAYGFRKYLDTLEEDERNKVLNQLATLKNNVETIEKSVEKANAEKED